MLCTNGTEINSKMISCEIVITFTAVTNKWKTLNTKNRHKEANDMANEIYGQTKHFVQGRN